MSQVGAVDQLGSTKFIAWRSACGLSLMAAVISVGMVHGVAPRKVLLPALAVTFAVSWLAMIPGLLAAYGLQRQARLRRLRLHKHLLDFWLPAVVGVVIFDGYVTSVTGRSSVFYLNLVIVKRAYRWVGSGGADANVLLFLPMVLTTLMGTVFARLLHSKLRQPTTVPARLWIPGLLLTLGLVLWPMTTRRFAGAEAATMTTDWERPHVDGTRLGQQSASPDMVLVIYESLRSDALEPTVMPFASSIAVAGVHFKSHYAGSNSSLLGLYGLLHGRAAAHAEEDLQGNVPAAMLKAFKQRGYQTAFFCGGDPAGYDEMDRLLGPSSFDVYRVQSHEQWSKGDSWAMSQLQACLADAARPPTLAIVFVMSTHFDYASEESGPFLPAANDWSLLIPWDARGSGHDAVVNRYRNAVHAADALVGRGLKPLLRTNTVIAITGDHGQALYDDGTVAHWSRLSDAQTRVPLVIAGPGIFPVRIDRATMHADVARLLLDGASGNISSPPPRPILLVQSNPGLKYEDWAVINGAQRTAWRRQGANITYQGLLDSRGQLLQ